MRKAVLAILAGLLLLSGYAFAQEKDTIVIGTTDRIVTLDPANAYDYLSCNVIRNIMSGLVDYKPGTLEIVPALAERWEISSDGLIYTFYLRKGVKFSDGTLFNARAVKFSIDRVFKLNGDPSFLLTDVIDSVEVVDDYTVRIKLRYPFAPLLSVMAFTVSFPVSPNAYNDREFSDIGVGVGPYKVRKWTKDEELILEVNPNWYGPAPKAKVIVIRFYENSQSLKVAIEKGEVDIAYRTLNPEDILDLKKDDKLKVYEKESPAIRYIVFNVKREPFNNINVRRAIAYAIDREMITKRVFKDTAFPLYSMIPVGIWGRLDVFPKYDREKAIGLLRGAGYSESKPLSIELWYTPTHYGFMEADVAQMLKLMLEATGIIRVDVKYAEWATYVEYFERGIMGIFLLGWYPDYIDPDDYIWPFVHSSSSPSLGSFYSNPKMDEILLRARQTPHVEGRSKVYEEAQRLLAEEVPYIPLWQLKQYCVAKPEIKGILLEPTQIFRYYLLYR
ncbi:MAG: ABC transporter substrate-binding protein [Synergistetes bacterium]|nr:ABC transporter substrate-binding protein [Synergistota bacterium]MCX8128411.1 ABC transporter substrate-binding protein [Synergistota bacterium]MDW8192911.1 ABC transporter substrate-binding protein [Synergistota bacterium]